MRWVSANGGGGVDGYFLQRIETYFFDFFKIEIYSDPEKELTNQSKYGNMYKKLESVKFANVIKYTKNICFRLKHKFSSKRRKRE